MSKDIESNIDIMMQKASNITKTDLINFFAVIGKNDKPVLPSNTQVVITKELLERNNSPLLTCPNLKEIMGTTTNIGRIVFWTFFFSVKVDFVDKDGKHHEGMLYEHVPFINKAFTNGVVSTYNNLIADLLIDQIIGTSTVNEYIDRTQWAGYTTSIFAIPSMDNKTLILPTNIKNMRDKLFKENKDVIDSLNVIEFAKMEKQLLDAADKELSSNGATGKYIYDSGFNGNWGNNYKVTSLFRGIVPKSDDFTKFSIATSNLKDGVTKEDIHVHADIGVSAGGGRAKDTQKGGYLTKIFNAAFGSIMADVEGSECGTNGTSTIKLDDKNYNKYRYRFIVDNGELVSLTKDLKKKYSGKTVQMRSPLYCRSTQLCHHCLGDMVYRLQIRNIGLHIARISSSIMGKSMKAFHNMAVTPKEYDLLDYIEEDKLS